jgi:hypothetical protein
MKELGRGSIQLARGGLKRRDINTSENEQSKSLTVPPGAGGTLIISEIAKTKGWPDPPESWLLLGLPAAPD